MMQTFRSKTLLALSLAALFTFALPPNRAEAQPEALGHVRFHQKISQTSGGFTGTLADGDGFGFSTAFLGDLDGDGVGDLAVAAPGDDDGGQVRGAVWILFLHANGTVDTQQKISQTSGGFTGTLADGDGFGFSVAALGDLDGDGVGDLAVGAGLDDDGGTDRGAVWILFLHPNGTVKGHQKISDLEGGFTGILDDEDTFGSAVSVVGDLGGDGTTELAVGAYGDDDGGADRGAVWILSLASNGTVSSHQKISATAGGFVGSLADGDAFGLALSSLGDLDGDGSADLLVGATLDDDGGSNRGAAWVLFLAPNGTVIGHQKISDAAGGFTGTLDDQDEFASSMTALGDLDCDGNVEIAVGSWRDDDGGLERGAVWTLFLDGNGMVRLHTKVSDTSGGFTGTLDDLDQFGVSASAVGDLDGDGKMDLVVGAHRDDDGGLQIGAVWVLFLDGVDCHLFSDGFESGTTGQWDAVFP